MKKEFETNKENYSKELQKQIKINRNKINKFLENTEEGLILASEKECFILGSEKSIQALLGTLVVRLYNDKVMTESELMHVVKRGIEFASFEREMKKDKDFVKKVTDILKSIEELMED